MTSMSSTRTTFALEAPPATPDIVITREFDAPRDRVFAAYVDAEAVSQWWGPRMYETVVDSLDARHGGTWRFTNRKDEDEHSFRGVYHDVVPAQRIVNTFEYEGMPGHVGLVTTTFEDLGGSVQADRGLPVPQLRGPRRHRRLGDGGRRSRVAGPAGRAAGPVLTRSPTGSVRHPPDRPWFVSRVRVSG